MQKNEEAILNIETIAFQGMGVARKDNFVIFIPFTLPGETVKAQILKLKTSYAEARPLEIVIPSPDRIKAPCPYFTACGGCTYQHTPYKNQLKIKTQQIQELYYQLTRTHLPQLSNIEPSPEEYNYRTKIRMKYKKIKGIYHFGYFDFYQNQLIDIQTCPIATKPINKFLEEIRSDQFLFFRQRRIKSYNLAFMETAEGIHHNLDPQKEITTSIRRKKFHYNRDTFFQINHSIFPPLFDHIFQILKEQNLAFESLLDLYCGVGFFGIILSELFEKIYFIEENKISYKFLLKNIEENHITHKTHAICASADHAYQTFQKNPEVILMDPPRTGSTEYTIQKMTKLSPKLIIYISCNPATQFRDSQTLEQNGYKITHLKPFDFFPQTKHIETLALYKPINN